MISINKYLLTLALVAGIAAPVKAMDAQEGSSLLNWKTAAGATLVLGIASAGVYKWLTRTANSEQPRQFGPQMQESLDAEPAQPVVEPSQESVAREQDIQFTRAAALRAQLEALDGDIVELRKQTHTDCDTADQQIAAAVAETEARLVTENVEKQLLKRVNRPKGDKSRRRPVRKTAEKPEVVVEESTELAQAPSKPLPAAPKGGQGHGVQLADLKKTQLKKTGVKAQGAPAKPLPQAPAPVAPAPNAQPAAESVAPTENSDVIYVRAANGMGQKMHIAGLLDTYAQMPKPELQETIRACAEIYVARVKSQALNTAVEKLFAESSREKRQQIVKAIKKNTLGLGF